MQTRNPEILAPAGSMDCVRAALRCGADAVYLGGASYSARNDAVGFDFPDLQQAADLCHLYGAKLHLAVNTLLTDKELPAFAGFLRQAVNCGIDACIVQDLGVLSLIHEMFPDLPLHASTQMSIHTPEGALQAKQLGCCRVVAAREMSEQDLIQLCALPMETEVFVHGALCMSVSGQCSFSALVGGRSANRGECAQACRLPWKTPHGKNLCALSLKDLSLAEHIQKLQKIGVDSFKIEGRMKRPEYVAMAVTAVRMALHGEKPDMQTLQSVFSRNGFTDGYFTGIKKNMFGYRRKEDVLAGQQVFKKIQAVYQKERQFLPLDFSMQLQAGKPSKLSVQDTEGNQVTVSGTMPEQALKLPLQTETLQKYLSKLGDTVYLCHSVKLNNPDGLTLSASQCNALRRTAVEALNQQRIYKNTPVYFAQELKEIPVSESESPVTETRIHIRTKAQFQIAEQTGKICCVPFSLAVQCPPGENIYLEAPRIIQNESQYAGQLKQFFQNGWKHLLCHNLADVHIGGKIGFILHGGFGLNCTNTRTAESLRKQGLQDFMVSDELSAGSIAGMQKNFPCGAIVYGRLPMMLFRLCPIQAQDGCHHQNCILTDRTGRKFPLLCSRQLGYTELYNAQVLWIADKLQQFPALRFYDFYFTDEKPEQIPEILSDYVGKFRKIPENRTNGLYFKGGLH